MNVTFGSNKYTLDYNKIPTESRVVPPPMINHFPAPVDVYNHVISLLPPDYQPIFDTEKETNMTGGAGGVFPPLPPFGIPGPIVSRNRPGTLLPLVPHLFFYRAMRFNMQRICMNNSKNYQDQINCLKQFPFWNGHNKTLVVKGAIAGVEGNLNIADIKNALHIDTVIPDGAELKITFKDYAARLIFQYAIETEKFPDAGKTQKEQYFFDVNRYFKRNTIAEDMTFTADTTIALENFLATVVLSGGGDSREGDFGRMRDALLFQNELANVYSDIIRASASSDVEKIANEMCELLPTYINGYTITHDLTKNL